MGIEENCISDDRIKSDRIFDISQCLLATYCALFEWFGHDSERSKIRLNANHFQGIVALVYKENYQGDNPDLKLIEHMTYELFLEPYPDQENSRIKGLYSSALGRKPLFFYAASILVCRQQMVPECYGKLYLAVLIEFPLKCMFTQDEPGIMTEYWENITEFEKARWKERNPGCGEGEFVSELDGYVFGQLDRRQVRNVQIMVRECVDLCIGEVSDVAFLWKGMNHYDYKSDDKIKKYIEMITNFIMEKGAKNELD